MADCYLRSTDGSDGDDGSTWALAKATLESAIGVAGAGETVYVSQSHAEVNNASTYLTLPGTVAGGPVTVVCGNDAAEPPTAAATSATVECQSSGQSLYLYGVGYVRGLTFKNGPSTGTAHLGVGYTTNPQALVFEACGFVLQNTYASARFQLGNSPSTSNDDSLIEFRECSFRFGASGQAMLLGHGRIRFVACSIDAAGSHPTILAYAQPGATVDVIFDDCDLSAQYLYYLLDAYNNASGRVWLRNCKLPSGVSPRYGTPEGPGAVELWLDGCNAGDVQNYLYRAGRSGVVESEFSLYGAATDGTTPQSWKLAASAYAGLWQPLYTPELLIWNETVGSALTVTVECLIDAATTLYDDELWLELEYPGTSGSALYTLDRSSRVSDPLATPGTCAAGAGVGAWTGEGGSAISYKVSATVTPQEVGVLRARVALGKPSTTIYVDPMLVVT